MKGLAVSNCRSFFRYYVNGTDLDTHSKLKVATSNSKVASSWQRLQP